MAPAIFDKCASPRILQILSFIAVILLVSDALIFFITFQFVYPREFILTLYLMIFALLLAVADLRALSLFRYFLFIYTLFGRGLLFVFIGALLLVPQYPIKLAFGVIIIVIGVIFVLASFKLDGIPKPLLQGNTEIDVNGRPNFIGETVISTLNLQTSSVV
eukprot:GHVL01038564.1.p1 GENE.GHVL01038564.1~~GHVL01038564.1.p1  ORF type:complete len:161 (-),score=4.58 GHVL01038564.1:67-549(-)